MHTWEVQLSSLIEGMPMSFLILNISSIPRKGFTYMAVKIPQVVALSLTIIVSSSVSSTRVRHVASGFRQCSQNSDDRYDRNDLLRT